MIYYSGSNHYRSLTVFDSFAEQFQRHREVGLIAMKKINVILGVKSCIDVSLSSVYKMT